VDWRREHQAERARALIARADAARDARDWAEAARLYGEVTAVRPDDTGMWVQLGHALREGGQWAAAETAYGRALALNRFEPDTHLHLGHVLKALGERDRAIAAYAQAARLDPGFAPAVQELLGMGARDAIPEASASRARDWRRVDRTAQLLGDGLEAVREWEATAGYSRGSWNRFRKDIPVRPPPGRLLDPPTGGLLVLLAARRAAPAFLRATLTSLQDQSVRTWRAVVATADRTLAHPVTGFAETDRRVTVHGAEGWGEAVAASGAATVAIVNAGTVLHPEALAWMLWARERTGAGAVFADQDRAIPHLLRGLDHAEPRLFGAFDRDFTLRLGAPALVLAARPVLDAVLGAESFEQVEALGPRLRRSVLLRADTDGAVAHVPRVLASALELPLRAEGGPDRADDGGAGRFGDPDMAVAADRPARSPERIAAIIPTRDHPDMLARAIASLRAKARDPSRVAFVIVDNRNEMPAARALLRDLSGQAGVTIVPMDEPFNWSRACNLGAAKANAPVLLFANDDIEMLAEGWDDALAVALDRPGVGAVGARLLYPDLSVQHAGIVFGMNEGAPEHEGRGSPFDDPGPDARLVSRRAVAAVTGAFLGVRRDQYDAVGGFDEARLFVGHNDIDFCLRLRGRGLTVIYEPAIEALHHEGATRGRNVSRAEVMWDLGEQRDLVDRWGAALAEDPGVNPHWTRHARPFDGLREPPMHQIVAHIDRAGSAEPWRPAPNGDPA
jgi:GT2 family glycosyltransferase/tetratricopeptide (TPR) repeat protein